MVTNITIFSLFLYHLFPSCSITYLPPFSICSLSATYSIPLSPYSFELFHIPKHPCHPLFLFRPNPIYPRPKSLLTLGLNSPTKTPFCMMIETHPNTSYIHSIIISTSLSQILSRPQSLNMIVF